MALTFFWRGSVDPLSGTDDYSAGDNDPNTNGAVSVGANGVQTTDASDWYYFDPTDIAATALGAAAFLIQFPASVPGSGFNFGIRFLDAGGTNYLATRTAGASTGFSFRAANAGATNTVTTSGVTISAGSWYGVVLRWDFAGDRMRIEVYNISGELQGTAGEDTAADTSNYEPTGPFASYGFQIGNMSTQTNVCYIKNIFVADAYDEPLQNNLEISRYSDYTAATGTILVPNPASMSV